MEVTFVGIGAIGLPMAVQIQQARHNVVGVEMLEHNRQRALQHNITSVVSFDEASSSNIVVVMVATAQQLENLISSIQNSISHQTWIIMSTVGPEQIRNLGSRLIALGAKVVDAPVTGGVARAKTGELVIFASGEKDDIRFVTPILNAMGRVEIAGNSIGDGQAIKVVNQHLCSVHIVAAAEALSLAKSLGLNQEKVLRLIQDGAAGSWMLSDRGKRMLADNDVEVTSTINIFVKDSDLVKAAAEGCHADIPLLSIANQRYHQAASLGLGQHDDSRVIETWGSTKK